MDPQDSRDSSARPQRREERVSWRRVFRVLLAAIFASTAVGLWYATSNRPSFQVGFPGSEDPAVYGALLATGVAGLVAVVGLAAWRRWAVALYVGVSLASIGLDVVARAPLAHQVTVLVGAAAVLSLVYVTRERFGWGAVRGGA